MKIIKTFFIFLTLLFLLFLLLYTGDTDPVAMLEKYGKNTKKVADGVGGWIVYRDQGKRDAPVLLLIHGSNASMQTYNGLIAQLSDSYRLISYDQHGHGLTGAHGQDDYSAQAKISTALKVLDDAGVDKAVWVGNSMGGWVTWRASLQNPERIKALILIDAAGAQTSEKIKLYLGARIAATKIGQILVPYIMPRFLVEKSIKENYVDSSKVDDALIDQYWQLNRFPGNRQAFQHIVATSREPEKWQEVSNISLPTLILWGEQDAVIPLSHAKAFNREIENSQLVTYPNLGHIPMEENPEQVAHDMVTWLEQVVFIDG